MGPSHQKMISALTLLNMIALLPFARSMETDTTVFYPWAPGTPNIAEIYRTGEHPEHGLNVPRQAIVSSKGTYLDGDEEADIDCGKLLTHIWFMMDSDLMQKSKLLDQVMWGLALVQSKEVEVGKNGEPVVKYPLRAYFATSGGMSAYYPKQNENDQAKIERQKKIREIQAEANKILNKINDLNSRFDIGKSEVLPKIAKWFMVMDRVNWKKWTNLNDDPSAYPDTTREFTRVWKRPLGADEHNLETKKKDFWKKSDAIRFAFTNTKENPHITKYWVKDWDDTKTPAVAKDFHWHSTDFHRSCAAQKLLTSLFLSHQDGKTPWIIEREDPKGKDSSSQVASFKTLKFGAQFVTTEELKGGKPKLVCMAEVASKKNRKDGVMVAGWSGTETEYWDGRVVPSCDVCQAFLPSVLAGQTNPNRQTNEVKVKAFHVAAPETEEIFDEPEPEPREEEPTKKESTKKPEESKTDFLQRKESKRSSGNQAVHVHDFLPRASPH